MYHCMGRLSTINAQLELELSYCSIYISFYTFTSPFPLLVFVSTLCLLFICVYVFKIYMH